MNKDELYDNIHNIRNCDNLKQNGINNYSNDDTKSDDIKGLGILKQNALSSIVNYTEAEIEKEITVINEKEIQRCSQLSQNNIPNNANFSYYNGNSKLKNQLLKCHKNSICYQCHITPIIGELFKCSQCPQYTLCNQCEESNYESQEHPHDFIRIRKKGESNEMDLLLGNHSLIDHSNLSVKLVSNNQSEYVYYRNVDDFYIEIILLNDGKSKWPRPTLLMSENNTSPMIINPEVIKPIMDKGDECIVKLKCSNCTFGIHKLRLLLIHETTGKYIGKPMSIIINVVDLKVVDIDEEIEYQNEIEKNGILKPNQYYNDINEYY